MEVPPLAPGMKESVDKCTKKTEIQKSPKCTIMYKNHSSGIVNPFGPLKGRSPYSWLYKKGIYHTNSNSYVVSTERETKNLHSELSHRFHSRARST